MITYNTLNPDLVRQVAVLTIETIDAFDEGETEFVEIMESVAYWERTEELTSEALNEQFRKHFASWDAYTDAVMECIAYLTEAGLDEVKKLADEANTEAVMKDIDTLIGPEQ